MVATMFIVWIVGTVASIGIILALLQVLYRPNADKQEPQQ